ncbi:MAG: hypothetical protein LBG58_04355, partial [Planctomycetaceae bacterium]|nr:hypothetical protein [Planctomycetaceae bacterium]
VAPVESSLTPTGNLLIKYFIIESIHSRRGKPSGINYYSTGATLQRRDRLPHRLLAVYRSKSASTLLKIPLIYYKKGTIR